MSPSHQLSNLDSWPTAKVDIARLILDGSTQARAAIDPAARARYMERYRDGLDMDPLVLFGDLASGPLWVGDGHTRASGALDAGMRMVEAQVRPGGQREALLYAISDANGRHGSPLTLTDRRKAAQILIEDPEWSQMADREIARRSGLSPSTIAALRPAPSDGETRKGADGKTRKLPQRSEPVDINAINRADLWQRFLEGKLTGPEARAKNTTWPAAQTEEDNRILAEYKAQVRAARVAGRTDPPFPPMPGGWLTAGAPVPKAPAADRWVRFLEERLTKAEEAERRTWPEEARKADTRAQYEWLSARKAAKEAGQPKPPYPPMPSHWLTPGGASDPAAAAAKALSAAEALGREDASRKSPRMIGEVVQRLRQASHLIPSGQDQAVYRAYCEARTAAVSRAAVEDTKTMPLPFEAPAPRPYSAPLFSDGPGAEILGKVDAEADDEDEDEDDFDPADDDRDLTPADDDREDEDELREAADMLEDERNRLAAELTRVREELAQERSEAETLRKERDQAQRDGELAAKAHAQALRTMEGMELQIAELRAKLDKAEDERAAARDELRTLREDEGDCGLVVCEGDDCARLALPNLEGAAVCRRHQQLTEAQSWRTPIVEVEGVPHRWESPSGDPGKAKLVPVPAPKQDPAVAPTWQPASIGGAKAVHALPDGADNALCSQRPSYSSKGWTPRPGAQLTCKGCLAATNKETT